MTKLLNLSQLNDCVCQLRQQLVDFEPEPEPCNLAAEFGWRDGTTSCQEFYIANLTGAVAPVSVRLNGGPALTDSADWKLGQPREGSVQVEIVDARGCMLLMTETNTADIPAEDIWIEPVAIPGASSPAGQSGSVGMIGSPSTRIETNTSSSNSGLIQYLTTEIIRARRGLESDPNVIRLLTDTPLFESKCDKKVKWSLRFRTVGTHEPSDGAKISLEWLDASGGVMSTEQIVTVSGGVGFQTYTGVSAPPAGAASVTMKIETWTNANAEWHYLYLSQDLTFMRLV